MKDEDEETLETGHTRVVGRRRVPESGESGVRTQRGCRRDHGTICRTK